jgi:hypothetical protein
MLEINVFDREFIHTLDIVGYITSTYYTKPKGLVWINKKMDYDGITIFTDSYLSDPIVDVVKSKIKIFLLLEPPALNPSGYDNITNNEHKFDYILTYDEELLNKGGKYVKYIVGQTRVDEPKIYEKTKMVSMIASNKRITEGHRYRHEIHNKLSQKHVFDMWGSGYKSFTDKIEPLSNYRYSISVMNSKLNNFFTEVLVDNFMCGTVPIFWGCPNISDYFDMDGVITFNTIEELDVILNNLSVDDYDKRLPAIKNNLKLAMKYSSTDDYIANVIKEMGI